MKTSFTAFVVIFVGFAVLSERPWRTPTRLALDLASRADTIAATARKYGATGT